jgi:hypothetical protein
MSFAKEHATAALAIRKIRLPLQHGELRESVALLECLSSSTQSLRSTEDAQNHE